MRRGWGDDEPSGAMRAAGMSGVRRSGGGTPGEAHLRALPCDRRDVLRWGEAGRLGDRPKTLSWVGADRESATLVVRATGVPRPAKPARQVWNARGANPRCGSAPAHDRRVLLCCPPQAYARACLPRRLCRPRHSSRACHRRPTQRVRPDPRRSLGSASYAAGRSLIVARSCSSASGGTGFTRCASKPASRAWRLSSSWPQPVSATRYMRLPQLCSRMRRATS